MIDSVFNNILYLLNKIFKTNKLVFVYCTIYIIFAVTSPFLDILFPKFLVDELTGSKNINKLIVILGVYTILSLLIFPVIEYLNNILDASFTKARTQILFEIQDKIFKLPYKYLENPNILNKKEMVIKSVTGFDTGVQAILNEILTLVISVFMLIGYIAIMTKLSYYLILYLLISSIIIYYITIKFSIYEVNKQNEIWSNDRESNYYNGLMNDFAYGKELRMFNIKELIISKFKKSINISRGMLIEIKNRHFWLSSINFVFDLVREGIVYIYI